MTGKNRPIMATVAKSERLQEMLENPQFREAWDGFIDELDKASDLIKRSVQPTGQAAGEAAQRVLNVSMELPK